MQSLSSVEGPEPTYSSIKSLNNNEDNNVLDELPDDVDAITDDDEDNPKYEININAHNYRSRNQSS